MSRTAVLVTMGTLSTLGAIGGLVAAFALQHSENSATFWGLGIMIFASGGLCSVLWFRQLGKSPPGP